MAPAAAAHAHRQCRGTSVTFRGQAFDLAPYTRDNVARVELR
jgi:hypothetical protein